MAYSTVPPFDQEPENGVPFSLVFIISVVLHVIILVGIPLTMKLFWKPAKFERPKAFELVQIPLPPNPPQKVPVQKQAPKQRMAQKEVKPEPKPVPSKEPSIKQKKPEPAKQKEAKQPIEENLDELASLLEEIPSPAQVSASSNFKYAWYLRNVQGKIERNWTPPTENKDLAVVVAFTIFPDGSISEPKIQRSSGNSSLDNLALRAVKLSEPFGKLPPGFTDNQLSLNCTLRPVRK